MTQGASRDEAVDRRANRQARPSPRPVERDGVFDNFNPEWGFDDREGEHGVARRAQGGLVAEALERLLNDRKAGDDIFQVHEILQTQPSRLSEDLDPYGCVNEKHERLAQ